MFVAERHQKILDLLEENGTVLVNQLSDYFGVSRDLIRKDLVLLESEGLLKRVYGGAILPKNTPGVQKKRGAAARTNPLWVRMAEKAASLIRDGETVFLDISPICLNLAARLIKENRRVTVVTNSIDILNELNTDSKVRLVFLGGKINHERNGFTGAITIEWMSKYAFDHAFIGVTGIDLRQQMVTTDDIDDALTKTSAIKSSRHSVLLAQSNQISRHGTCRSAALEDFETVIIDADLDENSLKALSGKINQILFV